MEKSKVSVIMANYNKAKYLPESIESVLCQTYENLELIIIDDCSSDDSKKIVDHYARKDCRIYPIFDDKRKGSAPSRNQGLKVASGEYIAILDSDDISLPNRLETQYNFLERYPEFFLVGSGAMDINKDGKKIRVKRPLANELKLRKRLAKGNMIYHSTIMFRNEKGNYYREKFVYSQDYDFYLTMLSKGKRLINIPDILIKYRVTTNAISCNESESTMQMLFALRARDFYHQRLRNGKDLYDEFDPNEILGLNVEKSEDKKVLYLAMRSRFRADNFKKVKEICKRYFTQYGYLNKVLVYYIASFLGKRAIGFIRKMKWTVLP